MQPHSTPRHSHSRLGVGPRRVRRWLKTQLFKVLGWMLAAPKTPTLPDWPSRAHRVLYLRYDRIGDMVLATGMLKAIRMAQPTVTVDVLASVGNAAVLQGNPYVGTVLAIHKRRPWSFITAIVRIRRTRYDAVLDPMVMTASLTAMLLMWLSRATHRVGVGDRGNAYGLTLPVPRVSDATHFVDQSGALLHAFGTDPRAAVTAPQAGETTFGADGGFVSSNTGWGIWRPELFLTQAELRQGEEPWSAAERDVLGSEGVVTLRLLVNVSAGTPKRRWPAERFVETLCSIRAAFPGICLLIVGSPADAQKMLLIGRGAGAPVAFTEHYRQVMALVAHCDAAFTSDTAITHIASAFLKPAVAMFAGGGGLLYGPYGTCGRVISTRATSLDSLPVSTVLPVLSEVINEVAQVAGTSRSRVISEGAPKRLGIPQ